MEVAAGFASGIATNAAGGLFSVVSQQVIDVVRLEQNLQVLHYDLAFVERYLRSVQTIFQNLQGEQKDIVDECLNRMKDALEQAKSLIVRVEQQRDRCFGCCILCNRKLSRECGQWPKAFDDFFQNLQNQFGALASAQNIANAQIPSNANQSVSITAPEAKPLLLQPVPEAAFVGSDIQSAEMQLQTWLAEPPHRVVGVWGMGGIGKTSLLKIIHNHFQKVSRIFENVIWVTVSQNFKLEGNFNIEGFYNSIAKVLDMKLDEKIDSNRARMEVCTFLENKKILLILDDLWEPIDFDEVGFSFRNVDKGSKVLISTRSADVIAAMGAKYSCWEMKLLSEEDAWKVFKSKAFTNDPDENIEAIAKEIAKKCQGLPLALKAVGAAMSSNNTKEDWSLSLSVMGTADQDFQANIDKQLRYSYDVLSKKLKICFLYCAAFPEDAEIDADRLVEIWIAEGVLTCGETTHLMKIGCHFLNELAKRCLIDWHVVPIGFLNLLNYEGDVKRSIKVHDVLREMAIRIGKSEEQCLFATNQHLPDFPREIEVSNCKRISLGHNDIQDLPNKIMNCPNLVSLLLPSNKKLRHVPEQFLRSVTSLRVLDLSWTGITGLPISVGELRLLEFLDLSHCEELTELPKSIGNLSALQFFNLDHCPKLKGLPSTIRGLTKLKHLNLDWCLGMEVNSVVLGQLTSLNRLVLSTAYGTVRAVDVINLTKMRMLKAVVTADGGVVTIDTWREIKELILIFRKLPESEESLEIQEDVRIENIESVEILSLSMYRASLPVCEFQNLKVLHLFGCNEVRELPIHSFPKLEVLHLFSLKMFSSLSGTSNEWSEGSMSELQKLRINECPVLMQLPLGMRLPSLQVLHIKQCPGLKELDIGNGDFPMLKEWHLFMLSSLQSITSSNGVWDEEAISKLEIVLICCCPLLTRISKNLIQLFKSNKMSGYSDVLEEGDNIDNESIAIKCLPKFVTSDDEEYHEEYSEDENIAHEFSPHEEEYSDYEEYLEDENIADEFSPHEEKYSE